MKTVLMNCRAVLPTDNSESSSCVLVDQVSIVVSDQGVIELIHVKSGRNDNDNDDCEVRKLLLNEEHIKYMDCKNSIIAPGFIDVQINGAFGVDFSDPDITMEQISYVRRCLLSTGVTSFLVTLVTCSKENYLCLLRKYDYYIHYEQDRSEGALILGIHLEGPFFNTSQKGAHNQDYIVSDLSTPESLPGGSNENDSVLENIYGSNNICSNKLVKLVTLAPELPGAKHIIKRLSETKIVVSMGHSNATLVEGQVAIENGALLITHLYNAMRPFHHREPGLLGLVLGHQSCYFSIIVDGIHCHPSAIALAFNAHPDGFILVTDAISAMGLSDGVHSLGSMEVHKTGRRATVVGTDTLAGSVVSMIDCVKSLKQFSKCSIAEAISKCTLSPSKLFHFCKGKGKIDVGASADFVLLSNNLDVEMTIVRGIKVYDRDEDAG